MIGRLRGIVLEKKAPALLLDVNGVAYEVEVSMHTFTALPEIDAAVELYTHLHVRADAQLLYGFHSRRERDLFRILLKINGVGAKLALTILSGMTVEQFCQCVLANDSASFVRLPGIGKKTAQRLLIEVRDRLPLISPKQTTGSGLSIGYKQEAIGALINLGYKAADAQRMIDTIYKAELSSEELIRSALQATMPNKKTSVAS